jgi:hypothetical protein
MPLRIVLPTLCITYADMRFTNDIGGQQENYPASQVYGPKYFDPPVELNGEAKVKKFTWIRGSHRVVIGPKETEIEWYPWKTLIVPRLRLDKKIPTDATIAVKDTPISVDQPLVIKVLQYADGRHVGGIRIEKRHPEWKPPDKPRDYDLWVRIVDATKREPLPEAPLNIFHWDPKLHTPYGHGGFALVDKRYTNGEGIVHDTHRPSGEKEAVCLELPGWRAVAHCFRPLGGQLVRIYMRAWQLKGTTLGYSWRLNDTLDQIVQLTGSKSEDILRDNGLADPSELKPGITIGLPCFEAAYRMEPGDTFEWLAESFGYESVEELAKLSNVRDITSWDGNSDIMLPGWHFFYAPRDASLEDIDDQFGLPHGSTRTVGRVHHPDPRLPYEGETIAVPTLRWAQVMAKRS